MPSVRGGRVSRKCLKHIAKNCGVPEGEYMEYKTFKGTDMVIRGFGRYCHYNKPSMYAQK